MSVCYQCTLMCVDVRAPILKGKMEDSLWHHSQALYILFLSVWKHSFPLV